MKERIGSLEGVSGDLSLRVHQLEMQLYRQGQAQVSTAPAMPPSNQPAVPSTAAPSTAAPSTAVPSTAVPPTVGPSGVIPPPPDMSSARSATPGQLPPPLSEHRISYPQPLPPQPAVTNASNPFTTETLLRWSGLVLVSLAAIFFVSTAINRGWIGPKLQLAGATAVGVGLHAGAITLARKARAWAYTMAHGATVVLAWSAAASYQWLELVPVNVALGLLAAVTLASTAIAVKFRFSTVALTAGIAAALMPLWMNVFDTATATTVSLWFASVGIAFGSLGLWKRWPEVRLPVHWVSTGLLTIGFVVGDAFDELLGRVSGMVALTSLIALHWLSPWVQNLLDAGRLSTGSGHSDKESEGKTPEFDEFIHLIRALDHRSVMAIPGVYLIGAASVLSSGSSSGIGKLGLMVAGGFTVALVAAVAIFGNPALQKRRDSTTGSRWSLPNSLPNSLVVSHLFGIGVVLIVSTVDLLDGPTLLIAIAMQALGSAAIAAYFRDFVLGIKSIVLGAVVFVLSSLSMAEIIDRSTGFDAGVMAANLFVVGSLAGFGIIGRYVHSTTASTTPSRVQSETLSNPGMVSNAGTVSNAGMVSNAGTVSSAGTAVSTEAELDAGRATVSPAPGWQWWSRKRPAVEVVDGVAWSAGLLLIASVVMPLADFSVNPAILAVFAGLSIVAYRFLGRAVLAIGGGLTTIGLLLTLGGVLDAYFSDFDLVANVNHLVVVLLLIGGAVWLWDRSVSSEGKSESPQSSYALLFREPFPQLAFVVAWIASLGWLGSVLINAPQGQVSISAVWAVAGCVALIAGIRFNQSVIRVTGLATLGVVIAKLLTVDLAEVDTLWRVGLFFILGLGFMRLGYVLPKLSSRYAADDISDDSGAEPGQQAAEAQNGPIASHNHP